MDDNVWRPAHLTSKQMEELRLAAATLLRQGRLAPAKIARQLGGQSRQCLPLGCNPRPGGSAQPGGPAPSETIALSR
jgi:hypothetical protein